MKMKPIPLFSFLCLLFGVTTCAADTAFFDFVDPAMTAGQRNQTIVPTQTLFLLSNDLLRTRAQVLADKLLAEKTYPKPTPSPSASPPIPLHGPSCATA